MLKIWMTIVVLDNLRRQPLIMRLVNQVAVLIQMLLQMPSWKKWGLNQEIKYPKNLTHWDNILVQHVGETI